MSNDEKSAMDALVDEVMNGREAAEAEIAPKGAPTEPGSTTDADDGESNDNSVPPLKFASGEDAPPGDSGDELEMALAERDSYLADSQRLAADFANFRKQSEKRVSDAAATQSASLVKDLIPVLDACDSALVQDPESAIAQIRSALIGELEKNGLELLAPAEDETFDPEQHEAVMHEAGDGSDEGPVVAEVLRAGYLWKGRVVRPAMVKVVG